jgi:polyisoprenoid-binding protein YceI
MVSSSQTTSRTLWDIDPTHALIEFSVRHLEISTIKGRFAGVQGVIAIDESNHDEASVEVEIDVRTLTSGNEARDQHLLMAPEFLDVEKYPTITFKSHRVELRGVGHALVYGDLTLHGVTKEIALDTTLTGFGKNPFGGNKEAIGFEARTTLPRAEFGVDFHFPIEGGVLVSDMIEVMISIEATKRE